MTTQLSEMFLGGNMLFMSLLTLMLALLFLAAWKAPAWVREIGSIALASGFLLGILGINQIFDYMQQVDSIPSSVLYGGYKTVLIPLGYGFIIYIVARIIYICQTPRI